MIASIVSVIGAVFASFAVVVRLRKGHGISILIPFRCLDKSSPRVKNVEWLKRYWAAQLPGAEIVIGDDPDTTKLFSKSAAVNNAASKAKGDVFVIIDADGYLKAESAFYCAEEIRHARKLGRKLWFVPYRQFYRLTEEASRCLLQSDPAHPFPFPEPLASFFILGDTDPKVGHWYGAMVQIMPREAFEMVGGWDERFRGWGGEDHAAMRAMDTLYGLHKTLPGQVLHIWHPQIGPAGVKEQVHWKERMWENQNETGINDQLSNKYYGAYRNPTRMRQLLEEGRKDDPVGPHKHHHRKRRNSI